MTISREASSAMKNIALVEVSTIQPHGDGSGMRVGKITTQLQLIPQNNLRDAKEKASSLKNVLLQKRSFKKSDDYGKVTLVTPPRSAQEVKLIKEIVRPCGGEIATKSIMRWLEVHKKNDITEPEKWEFFTSDLASRIQGFPEYAVVLGMIEIIEEDSCVWFPTVCKVLETINKHIVVSATLASWEK